MSSALDRMYVGTPRVACPSCHKPDVPLTKTGTLGVHGPGPRGEQKCPESGVDYRDVAEMDGAHVPSRRDAVAIAASMLGVNEASLRVFVERERRVVRHASQRIGGLTVKQAWMLLAVAKLNEQHAEATPLAIEDWILRNGYETTAVQLGVNACLSALTYGTRDAKFVTYRDTPTDTLWTLTRDGKQWIAEYGNTIRPPDTAATRAADAPSIVSCPECGTLVLDEEAHRRYHEHVADLRDIITTHTKEKTIA